MSDSLARVDVALPAPMRVACSRAANPAFDAAFTHVMRKSSGAPKSNRPGGVAHCGCKMEPFRDPDESLVGLR